jgi:dolichol-phosphate mannosyltransferase
VSNSLLILAYNEENTILEVISEYLDFFNEIIIVNDKSTDNTKSIINEKFSNTKSVRLINNDKNYGAGKSFEIGVREFLNSDSEYLIKIDGDNQFKKSDVLKLNNLNKEFEYDFVKADRFWPGGIVGNIPTIRYFGNAFASIMLKISTGVNKLNDPLNGLMSFSRKSLIDFEMPKLFYRYGYPFYLTSYVVNQAIIKDIKIGQTKNTVTYGQEKSQLKATTIFFKLTYFMIKNFFKKIKLKLKNSELQISAIADILAFFLFTLSMGSLIRFFMIRFTELSGPQASWFIVFLVFLVMSLSVLFYSLKTENKINSKKITLV